MFGNTPMSSEYNAWGLYSCQRYQRCPLTTATDLMRRCGRQTKTPTHPLGNVMARGCNGCSAWEKQRVQ